MTVNNELFQLHAACAAGGLFLDGFGDGLWLKNKNNENPVSTAFGILQASRTRITRTEFISCPSCGRTHFNLQRATAAIRKKTSHLVGLKIGIMGCIVNGPGEMADADYGYVGAGPGKITLYKGKEVIKKNIPEEQAVDELIQLIRSYGDWTETEI
jgi:(E)-4-hydroxy-3-methylbut-2-enyl-diphosphate synthase